MGRDEVVVGHGELDADQRRLDPADHQEPEREHDVHDAQPLVIHGHDPLAEPIEDGGRALLGGAAIGKLVVVMGVSISAA